LGDKKSGKMGKKNKAKTSTAGDSKSTETEQQSSEVSENNEDLTSEIDSEPQGEVMGTEIDTKEVEVEVVTELEEPPQPSLADNGKVSSIFVPDSDEESNAEIVELSPEEIGFRAALDKARVLLERPIEPPICSFSTQVESLTKENEKLRGEVEMLEIMLARSNEVIGERRRRMTEVLEEKGKQFDDTVVEYAGKAVEIGKTFAVKSENLLFGDDHLLHNGRSQSIERSGDDTPERPVGAKAKEAATLAAHNAAIKVSLLAGKAKTWWKGENMGAAAAGGGGGGTRGEEGRSNTSSITKQDSEGSVSGAPLSKSDSMDGNNNTTTATTSDHDVQSLKPPLPKTEEASVTQTAAAKVSSFAGMAKTWWKGGEGAAEPTSPGDDNNKEGGSVGNVVMVPVELVDVMVEEKDKPPITTTEQNMSPAELSSTTTTSPSSALSITKEESNQAKDEAASEEPTNSLTDM
jgi:hypothetical protein